MTTGLVMSGQYNYWLVGLSVLIAILASYVALDLGGRVAAARGNARWVWIVGGAVAMGMGIWSMHYIGMLAFTLPVTVRYHVPTVLLSLAAAVLASAVALIVVSRPTMGLAQATTASLLMGGGIAGMHYIGMAAMRLSAACSCSGGLVSLSVVLAVAVSMAAILLTFRFRGNGRTGPYKLAAALLMGAAIPVMHYTGMAAAHFTRNLERPDYGNSVSISDLGVFGIAFVTLIVLVTALVTSAVDRRFGHQAIELENSERRYRQLVDVAQVILWRRDVVTSEFDLVSGEAERLLGYPTRLWLEDPDFWMDHVHPEDRPYVSACWQKAARQGCHLPFEYRMVAADGRIVWLRASIGAVDIPSERSRLVAAMLDITGLKQAEQSLREQKHLLESLITTVPDSIYFKDLESRFVLINRAQAKLLGLPNCEDALGKSDADFFDETHAAKARIDEQKIMQTGIGMVEEEERELWPDGRVTWASTTKMPLIDMKGAMIGTLGMSKNITSRKRAEQWLDERSAELLAMNRRLQQEISERLLLESQLVQAQKLESIGQLAAGIAHELNTPIQYIGDNIRFLRDAFSSMTRVLSVQPKLTAELERLNVAPELVSLVSTVAGEADLDYLFEEVPRAIDQCAQGVQSVATIVMAMKEFSHPGKAEQATIDINHAIENTLVVCRNEWKYVADATTDLDPGLPAVRCFPGEFNQVILNLVVNAAHAVASAAREGREKGIIAVSTRSAGPFVEICIKDNGIGISAAAQPRIFTPFFTTKEIGKGTGQGLALARSVIVKKHKGTITFESEENVGTTFIVCLPIAGIGNDEVS